MVDQTRLLARARGSAASTHAPILIAGSGQRKTPRLAARYGAMCNLPDLPGTSLADDLKHKPDVLRSHCDDAGRDYGAIEKTVSTFAGPDQDPPWEHRMGQRAIRPSSCTSPDRPSARDAP